MVALPALRAGHSASCPRCQRELTYRARMPAERVLAYASAAIVMLLLTLPYPFLTFSLGGMQENIILLDTVTALRQSDWPLLALLIAMAIIVQPGMYLLAVAYVYGSVASRHYWSGSVWLARAISHIKPWLMTDVFLVGVLVSLVKLITLADISFGWSFWAFCGYVVLMAKTVSNVDSACYGLPCRTSQHHRSEHGWEKMHGASAWLAAILVACLIDLKMFIVGVVPGKYVYPVRTV